MTRLLPVLALAAALAGCAPALRSELGPGIPVGGGVPLTAEHTLSPGDEFEIRFPFAPDFNDRVTVGQDGRVSLKLVGEVVIGGLTLPEATARLRELYAKQVRAPDLSLTMRRFEPEIVYVDGWVNKVGLIRSEIPLTVERAVARAGGAKTGAKTDEILLIRRDPDGKVDTRIAALGAFAGAGRPDQDPLLKSFDIVYVPQGAIAAVADFVQNYVKNSPFAIGVSVNEPNTVTPTLPLGRPVVGPR